MSVQKRRYLMIGIVTGTIILCIPLFYILLFGVEIKSFLPQSNHNGEASSTPFISIKPLLGEEINNSSEDTDDQETISVPAEGTFEYIKVTGGCGIHFEDECLLVRSGPGPEFPVVERLRNGIVLRVDGKVEKDGTNWYKIIFDESLSYPERVTSDWYVAADYVETIYDEGNKTIWENDYSTSTLKKIVVDRSEQKLYATEEDEIFMEISVSTGLELTPTPRGTFTVFKKMPSRYMQGPLPGLADQQYYDLPGVPWNLYFTEGGAVIHGAYWHNSFGSRYSHGCVNLLPDDARKLYLWAELGTTIIVKD